MSEATRTAETKKELHRQEIAHLRATVKELEEQLRESLAQIKDLTTLQRLCQRIVKIEERLATIETGLERRGPSLSNPIPGAWPYVPAPMCIECGGPHRTGDCVR